MKDGRANNGAVAVASLVIPTAAQLKEMGREERQEIKEDTFWLLRRRLAQAKKNPGKAGRIEDTHLFSLATNLLKLEASERAKQEDAKRPPQVVNITQLLDGVPTERARDLLVAAIRQLEAAGQDATAQREALANLVGKDDTDRLLAIDMETT